MNADKAYAAAVLALSRRRKNPVLRAVSRVCTTYMDLTGNLSYDATRTGELRILESLAGFAPSCVFDVGANEGAWVTHAARLFPKARFHCFEIVPETAATLRQKTQSLDGRVTVNPVGLSNAPGSVTVQVYEGFSEGASAITGNHPDLAYHSVECIVTTGDSYCAETNIKHIDFLKIDTEGLDFDVLRGFTSLLEQQAVDVIQFEYGLANISSRALLADFYALLDEHGYLVGKIWPTEVDLREYIPRTDEDFRGPNFLAIRSQREDMIGAVR